MALLPDVFTPENEQANPFEPIAAGWYTAEITKSELKTTKDGKGKYISFCFNVIEGDHTGRMVYTNLNIVNKSDVAVKIAKADLKAICDACNIDELEDTEDLHNIPMQIKVSVKAETSQWPAKNELKAFKSEDSPL